MTGPNPKDLQSHALVTGAAQGIGAAIAVGLVDAGHVVTAVDVKDTAATVASIEAAGGSATGAQVDVRGRDWTVQAALPHLRRLGGHVVCVGSVAGRNGGLLSGPHYGASKGGVHAFVRWLAKTEAKNGILANAIAPGPIDTPMLQGRGYTADAVPLKRFGRAEEIASVAVFLAGPGASYITGSVLDANGGSFIG
jgi:3-oxoacyl-[acyl-carrier protein] reductase